MGALVHYIQILNLPKISVVVFCSIFHIFQSKPVATRDRIDEEARKWVLKWPSIVTTWHVCIYNHKVEVILYWCCKETIESYIYYLLFTCDKFCASLIFKPLRNYLQSAISVIIDAQLSQINMSSDSEEENGKTYGGDDAVADVSTISCHLYCLSDSSYHETCQVFIFLLSFL